MWGFHQFYPIADRLASQPFSAGIRDMLIEACLSADFLFDMLAAFGFSNQLFGRMRDGQSLRRSLGQSSERSLGQ
jgi:hypothetical protein